MKCNDIELLVPGVKLKCHNCRIEVNMTVEDYKDNCYVDEERANEKESLFQQYIIERKEAVENLKKFIKKYEGMKGLTVEFGFWRPKAYKKYGLYVRTKTSSIDAQIYEIEYDTNNNPKEYFKGKKKEEFRWHNYKPDYSGCIFYRLCPICGERVYDSPNTCLEEFLSFRVEHLCKEPVILENLSKYNTGYYPQ